MKSPRGSAASGRAQPVAPKPVASRGRHPAVIGRKKPVAPAPPPEPPKVAAVAGRKSPAVRGPNANNGRPPAAGRAKPVAPQAVPKPAATTGPQPAVSPRQPARRVRETPIALEPVATAARPRAARRSLKPIAAEPVAPPSPLVGLTRRDLGILDLVAAGRTDEQIAGQLLITRETARAHVSRIMRKLGVGSRLEAAEIARQGAAAAKS